METFEVKTHEVVIKEHPNADRLELAQIGDFEAIVRKDQMLTGDVVAYFPEASILPGYLVELMGLEGMLSGSDNNIVKARKFRKHLSQGLVHPMPDREAGEDVLSYWGIQKYEPDIPSQMMGSAWDASGITLKFDIENIKKYPNIFEADEEVVFTEKIHGTWCCLGVFNDTTDIVTSKGLSAKGLALKTDDDHSNYYVDTWRANRHVLAELKERLQTDTFFLLGEIYGEGVQDLGYGASKPQFRVFDLFVGKRGLGRYLSYDEMLDAIHDLFNAVPEIYRGPYEKNLMQKITLGNTKLDADHFREGIVIRPAVEGECREIGRRLLKSVSGDYLLRKNATEYN